MHCDEPPCVAACTTGASYQTEEGVVLVNYDICLGCDACVQACPYGARTINTNDAYFFDQTSPAPYESFGTQRINVAEKCTFCNELTDQGAFPACVMNCPGKARSFGDITDPESSIAKKLAKATQVGNTGMYYIRPDGLTGDAIASKVMVAFGPTGPVSDMTAGASEKPDYTMPIVGGVGAAVVVAGGIGAGVAVSKNKKKKAAMAQEAGTGREGEDHEN